MGSRPWPLSAWRDGDNGRNRPIEVAALKPADVVLAGAAWPGQPPQGRVLSVLLAGVVTVLAGPRAGRWQLATWSIAPLGEMAKRVINRPRPPLGRFNPMGGMAQSPSFPSTHVSNYVAYFGFASWILWHRRSRVAVPAAALGLALVGLIGPSRVRSGDHRWSDVAGGYIFGGVYLAALIALAKRDRRLDPSRAEATRPEAPPVADVNEAIRRAVDAGRMLDEPPIDLGRASIGTTRIPAASQSTQHSPARRRASSRKST
ncbi:MAG: phosphatase PAP2 family protein [Candidatus Dormibacteraeota bacterium]|nr:phosphatase PAP2 family protein [Candidatus Dormibacteraeota bacterium]